jgi:cytochrome c oxidase assembly factor CtaG
VLPFALRAWSVVPLWHPAYAALLALAAAAYVQLAVGSPGRRRGWPTARAGQVAGFLGGLAALYLAEGSPLGMLADDYLVSAHAAQHLLLALVAAPLLVGGLPLRPRRSAWPAAAFLVAWTLPWLPAVLAAGTGSDAVHSLEHAALLGAAAWLWAGASRRARVAALAGALPPAAALALAGRLWYGAYGRSALLLGLTPLADQRLAGWLTVIAVGATLGAVAVRGRRRRLHAALLAVAVLGGAVGCARQPLAGNAAGLQVALTVSPSPPRVGPARLTLAVRDGAGQPVALSGVEVRGEMDMPGMAPVVARALAAGPGTYVVDGFPFTMAGTWLLTVTGSTADGRPFRDRLPPLEVQTR